MVSYRIDWSEKKRRHGWGCSAENIDYYAVIGLKLDEVVKYQQALMNKKYQYDKHMTWLKFYSFHTAEHIIIVHKKRKITNRDFFYICSDNPGHHDRISEFIINFLEKKGLKGIVNKDQLKEGSSKGTFAHVLAKAFTTDNLKDIPMKTIIKEYKFESFDAAIPKKKKNY